VSDDQYAQRKRVLNRDSVVAFFATTAAYGKTRIMEYFKQLNAVSTTEESSAVQLFPNTPITQFPVTAAKLPLRGPAFP
jgi:hypothetical protein